MRILLLADNYYPHREGGLELYCHHLGQVLAREHEVVLACPAGDEPPPDDVVGAVRIASYPFPASLTRAEFRLEERPRGFDAFERWLAAMSPDVVHAHNVSRTTSLPHLEHAHRLGIRTIQTLHYGNATCMRRAAGAGATPMLRWGRTQCDGQMRPLRCAACALHSYGVARPVALAVAGAQEAMCRTAPPLASRMGTRAALPMAVRRGRDEVARLDRAVDRIVVSAEWQRQALLVNGIAPERVVRVPHGTHLSSTPVPRVGPRDAVVFGWAGRAISGKGLSDVLDAFMRIERSDVVLHLACLAKTPDEARYAAALRRRSAHDARVRWLPPFDPSGATEFYAHIDVFLAPYGMETGPLTVVEAFARGRPVVGYDLGGTAELVRDGVNGRLVAYEDLDGLRRAMEEASEPDTLRRWSAASVWTRGFEDVAADYLALYADPTRPRGRATPLPRSAGV